MHVATSRLPPRVALLRHVATHCPPYPLRCTPLQDLATTTELLAGLAATTPGMGGAAGAATKSSAASSSASPTSAPSALSSLVSEALEALPHEFDVEAAAAAYPVSYHQSLNQVLVQEMARYNRLLGALRGSLAGLGRALGGLALMGADVEAVAEAVAAGQVPAAWKVGADGVGVRGGVLCGRLT